MEDIFDQVNKETDTVFDTVNMELPDTEFIDVSQTPFYQEKAVKQELEQKKTIAETQAETTGFKQQYVDPQTGTVTSAESQGMSDASDVLFDIIPWLAGAGVAAKGYKMMHPISIAESAALKSRVEKDPKLAGDLLEAVTFAKENDIAIPTYAWRAEKGEKTGNAWLDAKLSQMKDDYKELEYDTLLNTMENIVQGPITADDTSKGFKIAMDNAYKKYQSVSDTAWQKYSEKAENIQLSKTGQKDLMRRIDSSIPNADPTVKNFINKTIFKNKEEGDMLIQELENEATRLKNRIKQYGKKLTEQEANTKRTYEFKLKKQLREIAETENKLVLKPLELKDLVEAKKMINNKKDVRGGSISTGNRLERHHLTEVNKVIDEQIKELSSTETLELYEQAKKASRDTFDTFGYDLTGKNIGVTTDVSGQIIKQKEIGAIKEFEKELMSSSPDVALQKFRKYEKLLGKDEESLAQAKKLYMTKIFGLDVTEMTTKGGIQKLTLDDEQLKFGLEKALGTPGARELTKEIIGNQGMKDLVAIRGLAQEITDRIPGSVGELDPLGSKALGYFKRVGEESVSGYDPSIAGLLGGTAKLVKSMTWDLLTAPTHLQGQRMNIDIINKLTKELKKSGQFIDEDKIRKLTEQLK